MTLERKDIRVKIDPQWHAALHLLAEAEQLEMSTFVERELVRLVRERLHAATVVAEGCARLGISGNRRVMPGMTGSGRE